jgi:glycosyltransferase involved in cell wall biosynthesis
MGGQPWGGSEALWKLTALVALKQGHQVLVSVYDWGKNTSPHILNLEKAGAQMHYRKKWTAREGLLQKVRRYYAKKYGRLSDNWGYLLKFKPDKVLINQGADFDMAMHHKELYYILKNEKIPYSLICHSHEQYSYFPDNAWYSLAKEMFLNATKVYFVSFRQWQLTERKLCTRLKNAAFTWNPLNLKSYEMFPWPVSETVQMAIVGNLNSGKGHDTLFEVLIDEKWKTRNYQLNIYGSGPGETYLKELCVFYNIQEKVFFKGVVASANEIWEQNHILLIPSAGEGLPISLVEAAICGRPAVVTDVGGNTEMIDENINGFIAEAPSVQSFDKAMERAWVNKDSWEEMGKKSHKIAIVKIDFEPEKKLIDHIIE